MREGFLRNPLLCHGHPEQHKMKNEPYRTRFSFCVAEREGFASENLI